MTICIIPARSGSKRIPDKNIKDFCGKPIIHYALRTAAESALFDEIIVSTDSEKVANVARRSGVSFITRATQPPIHDDYCTTEMVIHDVIDWMWTNGEPVDYICCLYATSVFTNRGHLARGRCIADTDPFCIGFAANQIEGYRMLSKWGNQVASMFPGYCTIRTQDPKTYLDAGQFYFMNAGAFAEIWSEGIDILNHDNLVPIVYGKNRVVDIDNQEDWDFAEKLYKLQMGSHNEVL